MRKPIILGTILVCCAVGRGAEPDCSDGKPQPSPAGAGKADDKPAAAADTAKPAKAITCASDKVVLDLLVIASNSHLDLKARTTAIDQIGKSKAALAVPALRRLLNDPPVKYSEWECFVYHVVRALENFHAPDVCDALPDLVAARAESVDPYVQAAIDQVLATINFAPPAETTCGPCGDGAVATWLINLSNDDASVALAAAKSLSCVEKADLVVKALDGLEKAVKVAKDGTVRRVAAESARTLLDRIENTAKPDDLKKYVKAFADALAERVQPNLDKRPEKFADWSERLVAAQSLGDFFTDKKYATNLDCVPKPLVLASADTNADVQAAAKKALQSFATSNGAPEPPKPAPPQAPPPNP